MANDILSYPEDAAPDATEYVATFMWLDGRPVVGVEHDAALEEEAELREARIRELEAQALRLATAPVDEPQP